MIIDDIIDSFLLESVVSYLFFHFEFDIIYNIFANWNGRELLSVPVREILNTLRKVVLAEKCRCNQLYS